MRHNSEQMGDLNEFWWQQIRLADNGKITTDHGDVIWITYLAVFYRGLLVLFRSRPLFGNNLAKNVTETL